MNEIIVKTIIKATVIVFLGFILFSSMCIFLSRFFKKIRTNTAGFNSTNKTMRECGYKKLPHPQGSFLCTKFTLNEEY